MAKRNPDIVPINDKTKPDVVPTPEPTDEPIDLSTKESTYKSPDSLRERIRIPMTQGEIKTFRSSLRSTMLEVIAPLESTHEPTIEPSVSMTENSQIGAQTDHEQTYMWIKVPLNQDQVETFRTLLRSAMSRVNRRNSSIKK